jgi:ABC-2 type transport system permease protein
MIRAQMITLLKREFWEHKTLMLYLPAVGSGLFLISVVGLLLLTNAATSTEIIFEESVFELGLDKLVALDNAERTLWLGGVYRLSSYPFLLMSLVVALNYLLGSMFNERKDRSILFWKSMPVSDALTVVSKLVTGIFVVPMIYLIFCLIAQLLSLFVLTLVLIGTDYPVWDILWLPINPISHTFSLLFYQLMQSFWSAPWFGYALLLSAWAKSSPVVWFFGIPVAVAILERVYSPYDGLIIFDWLWAHSLPLLAMSDESFNLEWMLVEVTGLLQGILAGMICVGSAVWLRGKHNEI